MKQTIILVSDNHYDQTSLLDIQNYFGSKPIYIHLGDSEMSQSALRGFLAVRGNNDYDYDLPLFQVVDLYGHRFFLTHGHHEYVSMGYETLLEKAKHYQCDFACFGHTHRYYQNQVKGIYLCNPGSLRANRDGTLPSFMKIEFEEGKEPVFTRFDYPYSLK